MSDLRTAAQQALEALEAFMQDSPRPYDALQGQAAMDALKAALAEPVLAPAPGYCKHCKQYTIEEPLPAEPVQQGCEHCNQPLYAAIKCRVCGRVTEPVQEPVAWIHTDPDKRRVKFLEWRENEPGYRGDWIKTPLYTAPPQPEERNFCSRCGKRRNGIHTCTPPAPLTDEVIADLWHQNGGFHHHFARAIERWLRGHA